MTDMKNMASPHPWTGQPYSVKREGVNITNCDSEPVHTPGCVQAHGALLVLNLADLTVVQASENVGSLLGGSPQEFLGRPVSVAVGIEAENTIRGMLSDEVLEKAPRYALTLAPRVKEASPVDVTVHTVDGVALVEFECMERLDSDEVDYFARVKETCARLETTNDLIHFCRVAAEDIRALTGFDRVMVYRFHEDRHGEVFAESKQSALPSWLGLHYPAEDIPEPARAIFKKIWQRPTPDVGSELAELVPLLNPVTKKPLDMTYCGLRAASIMYTEYLQNMKVTAGYTLSLRRGDKLWGLIACHHYSGPKNLPFKVRNACEFLAQIVSLQHRAVEDRELLLYRKELDSSIGQLIGAVKRHDDLSITVKETPTLLDCMDATGAAFYYLNRWWLLGKTPTESEVEGLRQWLFQQPEFISPLRPVYVTDCLSKAYRPAIAFANAASGLLALPLSESKRNLILWFRPEFIHTVRWAGNPDDKPTVPGPHGMRLTPRRSFEIFIESVRHRSRPLERG